MRRFVIGLVLSLLVAVAQPARTLAQPRTITFDLNTNDDVIVPRHLPPPKVVAAPPVPALPLSLVVADSEKLPKPLTRLMKTYAVSLLEDVNESASSRSRAAFVLEARITGLPLASGAPAYR